MENGISNRRFKQNIYCALKKNEKSVRFQMFFFFSTSMPICRSVANTQRFDREAKVLAKESQEP